MPEFLHGGRMKPNASKPHPTAGFFFTTILFSVSQAGLTNLQRQAMKTRNNTMTMNSHSGITLLALCILLCAGSVHAVIPPPGSGPEWLDFWTFNSTNTWITQRGYAPASFTNIAPSELGDYWAATVDDT